MIFSSANIPSRLGSFKKGFYNNYGIFIIVILAAIMRLPALFHGMPTYVYPSEYEIVATSLNCLKGDIYNEWISYYGGFYYYTNALFLGVFQLIYHGLYYIKMVDEPSTPYWLFYVVCRALNLIYSLILLFTTYGILNKIAHSKTAIIGAGIMASLPLPLAYSLRVAPDILCTLLVSLSIYFSVCFYTNDGKVTNLFKAALFAGLAIGTKLMFLAPVPLIIAKLLVNKKYHKPFFDRNLIVVLCILSGAIIIAHPSTIIIPRIFYSITRAHSIYSAQHRVGVDVPLTALYFIKDLFTNGVSPTIFLVSLIGIVFAFLKHRDPFLIIALTPLLWSTILSTYKVHFTYNIMIITLPISIFSAVLLVEIVKSKFVPILFILIILPPLYISGKHIIEHCKKDLRFVAAEWIKINIPKNSYIAREEYTPKISKQDYRIDYIGICGLLTFSPDSIKSIGYDYLITASHDRFLKSPIKHKKEIKRYNDHLFQFPVVKEFNPGTKYRGMAIRILKVD